MALPGASLRSPVLEFWRDLQDPGQWWQIAGLAACLLAAWWIDRTFGRRAAPEAGGAEIRSGAIKRLLFPLSALLLVVMTRPLLASWTHVNLLDIAVPLLGSLAVIRMVAFALRHVSRLSKVMKSLERVLAFTVWSIFALHMLGLLEPMIDSLQATTFAVGKQKLSVWHVLEALVTVLAVLTAALWAGGIIEERLLGASEMDSSLRVVLARIVKAVLVVVAILVGLPMVGIDLTMLSVFGGALGVGLGLGLQRIASNYVSGFIILLDRSIRLGNVIEVDRYGGEVTEITTRYTVLRAPNGVEAIVPNETLVNSVVLNQTFTNRQVRVAVRVSVSYRSDLEQALDVLVRVARQHPRVLDDPEPRAFVVAFGDNGIDLELGVWIADPLEGTQALRSELMLALWRAFRESGLEIPYPQREVHVSGPPAPAGEAAGSAAAAAN